MRILFYLCALLFFQVGCVKQLQSIKPPVENSHEISKSKLELAISTSEPLVARVAGDIFKAGGNIVDASVAASFAISVVRPQSTGIGGGGFLVFYQGKTKKTLALDFREVAPGEADEDMYLDESDDVISGLSTTGVRAVAVPGLVAGLYHFHQKFGKLPWHEVLEPSISLAKSKIRVSKHMALALKEAAESLEKDAELKKIFFKDHHVLKEAEYFVQPQLAKTLALIAQDGEKYFYEGEFAEALEAVMKKSGGLITREDLKNYEVIERSPLVGLWRGHKLLSFPPPSSGGVNLFQILRIVDDVPEVFKITYGKRVAEIEAMKRAFIDRAFLFGDPDFTPVPTEQLISESYLRRRAQEIAGKKILPAGEILPWSKEKTNHETTHLSLMDSEGNAISTTQSINGYFGAKVSVPGTGVILNNTMDDFSIQPGQANQFGLVGGRSNRIQPEKHPLSSMTPTIVLDANDRPVLVLGAPGGSRIISSVYYVLSRILRDHQSPEEAIAGCRFHHQWMPDKVLVEPECILDFKPLEKFYKIEKTSPFGEVQVVGQNSEGRLFSVVDPRGHGEPLVSSRSREIE
jgi:gamma-glutamyltranspeptidase/glutathione hydrolase